LRPAALSYLEIESTLGQQVSDENPFPTIDRSEVETDFNLNQKSYALTINAVSMLATNRPTFFGDSASSLARRTIDPPTVENSALSKAATMAISSHLRASCLTLLRNALSVTSGSSDVLLNALSSEKCGMKIQADKALRMAKQAASLKTAGRAARNRAAVFYEWEGGAANEMETDGSKRKRAGQDKLEQMRAAKAARGLGNGIQLPKSMADACELILLNLGNLSSSRTAASIGDKKKSKSMSEQKRRKPFTLDFFVDAIITNGASLSSDENRWYGRDGGDAWVMDISALISDDEIDDGDERMGVKSESKKKTPVPVTFALDTKTANAAIAAKNGESSDDVKLYQEQCEAAAVEAFGRILDRSRLVRDPSIADFGNQIAARMAWSLKNLKPHNELKSASDTAIEGAASIAKKVADINVKNTCLDSLPSFANEFPLVASCIQFDLETKARKSDGVEIESIISKPSSSLTQRILNEAFLGVAAEEDGSVDKNDRFEKTLELYISSVIQACEKANEKPMDNHRKKLASTAASSLSKDLGLLPTVTESSLELASLLCNIDEISKKAVEASRKTSNQNLATAAATNGMLLIFCFYIN
jgi:symplekin